jgi:hypothetical protein
MHRHDALIPFSHVHQHALANALRLTRAVDADDAQRADIVERFLTFVDDELDAHERAEERLLQRACAASPAGAGFEADAARVRHEHERLDTWIELLRRTRAAGATPDGIFLAELGRLLHDHVRYEERSLFEQLQQVFGDDLTVLVGGGAP